MQTADAVVIGAGINGSAIAYNLVKSGLKDVILLDKGLIASAGTGDSSAIVRQHYSHGALIKLVKRSVELFLNFDDAIGGNPDYHSTGWAFLVPQSSADAFDRTVALQQELGVETSTLSVEELHDIEPRIQVSDVARIAFEPQSGYCEPTYSVVHAYVRRFVDLGGTLLDHTAASGLDQENGRIAAVRIGDDSIHTPIVVNAAGPWAARVAAWVGATLPIEVTREQEFIVETGPFGGPPALPISDFAKAIYYRPQSSSRTLLGRGFPKKYETGIDADAYIRSADGAFIEEVRARFAQRFPTLKTSISVRGFSGLYDVTPDWNPILGPVDEVEGFYICAGFSGHGFKLGPAIGECLAEVILDGKSSLVDLGVFSLKRFESGAMLYGAYGGNRA